MTPGSDHGPTPENRLAATSSKLQEALNRFSLGELVEFAPATGGNWKQNLFVTTTTATLVFRGAPMAPAQFLREQFFIEQVHLDTAVPVPWPYLVDEACDLFGWPYVLMPRLPGREVHDPVALAGNERQEVAASLGQVLGELQQRTWPVHGSFDANTRTLTLDPPGATRLVAKVQAYIAASDDWPANGNPESAKLTSHDKTWVQQVLADNVCGFDADTRAVVVHGDFHDRNVVVGRRRGAPLHWQVTGLFDFAEARVGYPEEDLPRAVSTYARSGPEMTAAFMSTYLAVAASSEGAASRYRCFSILDRLLIWGFGWGVTGPWWDRRLSFKAWAEPYVLQELGLVP